MPPTAHHVAIVSLLAATSSTANLFLSPKLPACILRQRFVRGFLSCPAGQGFTSLEVLLAIFLQRLVIGFRSSPGLHGVNHFVALAAETCLRQRLVSGWRYSSGAHGFNSLLEFVDKFIFRQRPVSGFRSCPAGQESGSDLS